MKNLRKQAGISLAPILIVLCAIPVTFLLVAMTLGAKPAADTQPPAQPQPIAQQAVSEPKP